MDNQKIMIGLLGILCFVLGFAVHALIINNMHEKAVQGNVPEICEDVQGVDGNVHICKTSNVTCEYKTEAGLQACIEKFADMGVYTYWRVHDEN